MFICSRGCSCVMKGWGALLCKPTAPGCLALDLKLGAISSDKGLLQGEPRQLSSYMVILI